MLQLFLILFQALQILNPPQIESEAGCIADPNGKPRCFQALQILNPPQVESEAGCGADPDGKPKCSP